LAKVVLNHKQLFGNATQLVQNKPDLVDPRRHAQVGIDHQYAVRACLGIILPKQLAGNTIPRFQHRVDGRNLRRFIGDEMNEHLKADRRKPKSWLINFKKKIIVSMYDTQISLTQS
jgi:hypothetical protein